ncbi:OLC1v1013369C1 [Oldenlandia corymbosa var. corymbosa]|uniref:OLC1v1013369C1 n=1 Tax=Oldenlandia corymbosa var. corymbosa TaxID=529605 RepID=A0AAV1DY43_OLDCO|nr:OLC1v1013369C1 [Oldenlandia corymbosa var. corymbosa]
MAKSMISVIFICAMLMSLASLGHGAITCNFVNTQLRPCKDYVLNAQTIDFTCCIGAKNVAGDATTPADHQAVCSCLKPFLSSLTFEQLKVAAAIPGICDVQAPFPITRDVDCSKVNLV